MPPMDEMIDTLREADFEKSIAFISYAGDELALADFVRNILHRWTENKIEAFVAKRDIPSGDNPLKVMMEEKLKHAKAIISICSMKSKTSAWVWWESASVWARGGTVYPLFTNITAEEFGAPLNLVSQGKDYFDFQELENTVKTICKQLRVKLFENQLSREELEELVKLKAKYFQSSIPANIEISYKKLLQSSELHKYYLIFNVVNTSKKAFRNVVVELYFPSVYIDDIVFLKDEFEYMHSYVSKEKPGYTCITFDYSALPPIGKRSLGTELLPGKKFGVFGEGPPASLHYVMDHQKWLQHDKFEVEWKVYINGEGPLEGKTPFHSLQNF